MVINPANASAPATAIFPRRSLFALIDRFVSIQSTYGDPRSGP
jgi:hypothetical protein